MGAPKRPRWGSLQFYPRKKIDKFIPSVNWSTINADPKTQGLLGFITYKVGMSTALVKDVTDKSMTQNKKMYLPVTILEAPSMKLFAIRFYKNNIAIKDVIVSNEKELKRIVRVPGEVKAFDSQIPADFDDIRAIVYTLVKKTSVKKTPDVAELAINAENKLDFVKSLIGKEITPKDFVQTSLVDTRGLTTGKGNVGPVKRFGLSLKSHKSEKGVRRPGSLGPWHPARVTFHAPQMGQMGLFNRIHYNIKVLAMHSVSDKNINPEHGFKNYGMVKTNYIILAGSVQGPSKRQILLTTSFRPTKMQAKKKYEFLELIK
jgi:large subunit ribosomal protein L3